MPKIKVGVLRGGPSAEYEISLLTGENVLNHLPKNKYEVHDILWTKDNVLHQNGFPKPIWKIVRDMDVIFNALHGEYGEDGRVQQILEAHLIPYTGSGIVASAAAMKKHLARGILTARLASLSPRSRVGAGAPEEREKFGLKVPRGVLVSKNDNLRQKAQEIALKLPPWWVIKPASRGSSVGVTIAKTPEAIVSGLEKAFEYDNKAIAEEYISGREATCGVLENLRGQAYYPLPVIEICPPDGKFFDYEVKYNGETREICPGRFDAQTSKKLQAAAVLAQLTEQTNFSLAAEAIGLSFPKLLDHLVTQARRS